MPRESQGFHEPLRSVGHWGRGTWHSELSQQGPRLLLLTPPHDPLLKVLHQLTCLKARPDPFPAAPSFGIFLKSDGHSGGTSVKEGEAADGGRGRVGSPFPKATVEKGCGTKAITEGVTDIFETGATSLCCYQEVMPCRLRGPSLWPR